MAAAAMSGEALVAHVLSTNGDATRLFGTGSLTEEFALKRAYKAMALRLHPDKNTHAGSHEAFQLMQRAFEAALESLRSRAPAPAATHATPPPPPPPQQRQRSAAAAAARPPPSDIYQQQPQKQREQQQRGAFSDNDLFEIPLPPDVFGEFTVPSGAAAAAAAEATEQQGSRPLERCTKPLPALDLSSSDGDNNDDHWDERVCQTPRRDNEQEGVKKEKKTAERRAVRHQKRDASRSSLKQLFAEFNISDDEGEKEQDHHPGGSSSSGRGTHREPCSAPPRQQQEQPNSQRATTNKVCATVACPSCGAGKFPVQIMAGVVCPACRFQFVPTAVSMMATERHATGRKKGNASLGEMCACGRAKKGLCFLCN
ncbi:hypothetical protein DQ04_00101220 [Trypanosoma grayi]|uniref:hypothetical protein n=1 Tax=Trypanosoma grayi TaxID=71804 RepID=UPI0004F45141|nr:hypothetical protein DQ04_00101220 [Trypanosoma grayi]KEG15355.1 hypothetical protein DQ04_00101220 [Trypanosoma grayi]